MALRRRAPVPCSLQEVELFGSMACQLTLASDTEKAPKRLENGHFHAISIRLDGFGVRL